MASLHCNPSYNKLNLPEYVCRKVSTLSRCCCLLCFAARSSPDVKQPHHLAQMSSSCSHKPKKLLNKLLAQMTVALYACRDGYCDLPCNTARLAHHSAFKVIQVIDFNAIWKPVFDFLLVIDSNLGPILHRLVTIHVWQTDGQTDGRTATTTKGRSLSLQINGRPKNYGKVNHLSAACTGIQCRSTDCVLVAFNLLLAR